MAENLGATIKRTKDKITIQGTTGIKTQYTIGRRIRLRHSVFLYRLQACFLIKLLFTGEGSLKNAPTYHA